MSHDSELPEDPLTTSPLDATLESRPAPGEVVRISRGPEELAAEREIRDPEAPPTSEAGAEEPAKEKAPRARKSSRARQKATDEEREREEGEEEEKKTVRSSTRRPRQARGSKTRSRSGQESDPELPLDLELAPQATPGAEEEAQGEKGDASQKASESGQSPPEQEESQEEAREEGPPPEVPESITLEELRAQSLAELYALAEKLPVRLPAQADTAALVFAVARCYLKYGTVITASGILEQGKSSYGMLRDPKRSFRHSPDDLYLSGRLIDELSLRPGQEVRGTLTAPRNSDHSLSIETVLEIDGQPREGYQARKPFAELTSIFPEERFMLDGGNADSLAVRVVDLVAPLGKGQRGLIVAPPRGGKTILLKQIARAIQRNHAEVELIILLLDERPEEVTDFEETVEAAVYASTFDEPSRRHAQVSDLVLERARRLVEEGKDVVILLDSLTRLARGYNNSVKSGPIGSGGLSPKAIAESRAFFGAARAVEEGGSLTILATCLIETESRMDDVIFEELKGTGNMEVRLDRILAEQRIYPAIHLPQSGTRNDERLYHPDEFSKVVEIRKMLAALPIGEALETLLKAMAKTKSNPELLLKGLR